MTFLKNRQSIDEPRPSKQIGLVIYALPFSNQVSMEIVTGVEQAARSGGYQIVFTYSEDDLQQQRNITRLIENKVAGMIVISRGEDPQREGITRLHTSGIPYILVDRHFCDDAADWVTVNNRAGGYQATQHLVILGHRRIALIYSEAGGGLRLSTIRDRWQGYLDALATYGLPCCEELIYQYSSVASQPSDDDTLLPLLRMPNRPTAIFAVNDQAAMLIIKAALRYGLRIPQDLSIVAVDDFGFCQYLTPPLTVITQLRREMGRQAAYLLLDRLADSNRPPQHIELPTILTICESCGAHLKVQNTLSAPI